MRRYVGDRGFSLVELMLALSLLAFVIAISSGYYVRSAQVFRDADQQSRVQVEVTRAVSFISTEVRNAVEIEVLSPAALQARDPASSYIFVDNGALRRWNASGETIVAEHVAGAQFELISHREATTLEFTLQVGGRLRELQTRSEVLLNNITEASPTLNPERVLRYKRAN